MLDGRKLARMSANRARMRQGRTRTVTLVYARPEGTAYVAAGVVWRAQSYAEPALAASAAPGRAAPAVRAEFPPELDRALSRWWPIRRMPRQRAWPRRRAMR